MAHVNFIGNLEENLGYTAPMAPNSSRLGSGLRSRAAWQGIGAFALTVHLTGVSLGQEQNVEAAGSADPAENAPAQVNPTGAGTAPSPQEPEQPAQGASAEAPEAPGPAGDGVRVAPSGGTSAPSGAVVATVPTPTVRNLIPTLPDPRLRSLDTSFPAEQLEDEAPEPPRVVIAPPSVPAGPGGPSRRMLLRTVNGVTVLTNVDEPDPESPDSTSRSADDRYVAINDRPASAAAIGVPGSEADVRSLSQSLSRSEPTSSPSFLSGASPWLWGLGSFAAVLLVPIAVLLTRPVRKG